MEEEEASKKKNKWLRGAYRRLLSRGNSPSKTKEIKQEEDGKDEEERARRSSSNDISAHPVIRILEAPSKRATSSPEFLRYLEYLKEGGTWEPNSERPFIYFK